MDYRIRRAKGELESTAYMEIGPGKYSGAHWQDGFLFVWQDAFGMAEGIVAKYFADYDHLTMNELPEETGRKITHEWRNVAEQLQSMNPEQAQAALNLRSAYRQRLGQELDSHRSDIAQMLRELADACDGFYTREKWICILGM